MQVGAKEERTSSTHKCVVTEKRSLFVYQQIVLTYFDNPIFFYIIPYRWPIFPVEQVTVYFIVHRLHSLHLILWQ